MDDRHRRVLVVAAGLTPLAIGAVLDGYVDPVLIWGGRICGDARNLAPGCMLPPYALLTAVVTFAAMADHLLEQPDR